LLILKIMTTIEPVNAPMLDALVRLEQQTFTETFTAVYQPVDLAAFLKERKSHAAIAAELSHPQARYYLLYHNGEPGGFLKLNVDRQPDDGTLLPTPVMELEKIYVLQALQGKHLGKALIEHAYAMAKEHQVKTLWLGVWEHNTKAYRFYSKEGFEKFGTHAFKVGQQTDTDWLLRKTILDI
jgi:ribosomal protein S18 acetylase RimI-like enzyme